MMKKSYVYRWWVEHLDDATNEYISQILPDDLELHLGKKVMDGSKHTLWDCGENVQYINALMHSKVPLRYNVYREGHDEVIRPYLPKKVKRLPPPNMSMQKTRKIVKGASKQQAPFRISWLELRRKQ